MSVSPATVSLLGGAAQAFTATVSNDSANAGVTWSIGTGAGTLSASTTTGVTYTAPATVTATATVTLTATSITDKTKSGSATITLSPPPITVTVSPATATLTAGGTQAFAATLTNDTANAGVTWSIGTGAGALSANTTTSVTYTAPASISAAATVTLTATSITDKTKSGTAAITLSTAPPPAVTGVSVSCNPTSFETWGTSQCTPTVTGTGSYSSTVAWSVNGVAGGNSTVGVVSSTGVYTAPNTVPTTNPVTVTATSTADKTKSGSANLTITTASGTPSITALSETKASPFDAITITGTNFNQGTVAVSVIFTPESGDKAIMVPVSATSPTSLGVMVPTFSDSTGAFAAETVDVQVFLYSSTKTWLTNTIKALPVAVLPPVPSSVSAGTMTAALLSSATKTSTTVQGVGSGVADLAKVSASLSQLNTDISPISTAATTIAASSGQSVNLTTANGATTPLNAKILAQSDQMAQAIMAAIANQASIPTASSTTACPAATGNTAFDNNLCNSQVYFQAYASQATPSGAAQCLLNPEGSSVLTLTPPDAAALTVFANLALGGLAEVCEPAGGGLFYSLVGAPIVTSYISSLAVNQEMPSGTDVAQGVGLNFLDQAAFAGTPILGTSVDMYKALAAFVNYSPPVNGILLSSGVGTFTPGGETFVSNGTTTTLLKLPDAPAGGSFDSTSLVISQSGLLTLSLSTSGSGSGSIASFPTGTQFPKGTVVSLVAVPATGSEFANWGGACSGNGACIITMNAPESVSATFNKSTFNLTVSTSGTGTGTVAATPTGTSCGSGCTSYATGTVVTLTATAASGSTFAGWGGACSGTGSCTVTMNADESVSATFKQNLLDLTWGTAGTGSGSVAVSPAGALCGSDCYSYASGTVVTLTATPGSNSTFEGWSGGGCSGTGECEIAITSNVSVTATFTSTTSGSTPGAGNYAGTCTASVSAITCCSGGQCTTVAGVSDTEPFDFTLASGTSLSQFTSEVCGYIEPALEAAGCASTAISCSNTSATSTSASFGFSCTPPSTPGCTGGDISETCSLTKQ